jgi:putative flavoprotein involved in K+ transport
MPTTDTVIIGAGQAGLTLSRHLARAGHAHAVLERGRVGERWRSERWDSLTLLTPNWLNRLDGGDAHADLDGYLRRDEFVDYLNRYARGNGGAVHEQIGVTRVEPFGDGFRIDTDRGRWQALNVVIATGDSAIPRVPAVSVPRFLHEIHASRYRNPKVLPPGGVLVVGAGPSGQQITAELRRAGRTVVLAVGRHARMMRRYRGRDIFAWLKDLGDLDRTLEEVHDEDAVKRAPSFALTGANAGEQLDLGVLHRLGVIVAGRFDRFAGSQALFAPDLQPTLADAERRMHRLFDRIDEHAERVGLAVDEPDRLGPVELPAAPAAIELEQAGISTVIWATGYRRDYPWLHLPVVDANGEMVHRRGVAPVAGVYVLGLKFQHRRSSHFIGGVGGDARFVAAHLVNRSMPCRRLPQLYRRLYRPTTAAMSPGSTRAARSRTKHKGGKL